MELVEKVYSYAPVTMPYVPGFLSFREAGNVVQAFAKLAHRPDVIMVDGHGIAHPRRVALPRTWACCSTCPPSACQAAADRHFRRAGPEKGSLTPLTDPKPARLLAKSSAAKTRLLPLFVSPGHRCDQATATRLTLACLRGYKLPEPPPSRLLGRGVQKEVR